MPLPASPSTPHAPAPAAAGEEADAEPAVLAAPAVDAAAIAAQCRYDAAAAKNDAAAEYKAAAAKYEAKIGTGEATAFKELKDEAFANLQSANEFLALTFPSISDAAMSSSRKR